MTLEELIEVLTKIKEACPGAETEIDDELFVMFPPGYHPPLDVDGAIRMGGGYLVNADS